MAFQPKKGKMVSGPGFKPSSGKMVTPFAPQQPQMSPEIQQRQQEFTNVDISQVPQGVDPSVWNTLDESGKRSMAVNMQRIQPEKRLELGELQRRSGQKIDQMKNLPSLIGQDVGAFGAEMAGKGVQGVAHTLGAVSDAVDFFNPASHMMRGEVKRQTGQEAPRAGDFWRKTGEDYSKMATRMRQKHFKQGSDAAAGMGGLTGTIASMIPGMVGGASAEKAIKGLPFLQKLSKGNVFQRFAGAAPGAVAESIIGTGTATGALEGRLPSMEELAAGGAIDAGLRLIGGGLGAAGKGAYKRLLGLTRGQKGKLAERGLDVAGAMAKKGYVGLNRGSIAKKIQRDVTRMSKQLDDLIAKAEKGDSRALVKLGETSGLSSNDLLKGITRKKILQNKMLKPKFGDLKSVNNQIRKSLGEFTQTMGNKPLTLQEVQNFKKTLGNSLSKFYAKSGDATATAKELVNDALRKNAKEIIEQNVKGVAELNKAMSPLIEAKEVLKTKGDYSGTLGDLIISGAVGGGSLAQGQDPMRALQNAALGVALKKGITSPLGRSLGGKILTGAGKAAKAAPVRQTAKTTGLNALTNLLFGKKD